MKKLNTIFSFVLLSFCLLINVSFAEWTNVPTTAVSKQTFTSTSETIAGYTLSQIRSFFKSDDISARNIMLDSVKSEGYYVLWVPSKDDLSEYITLVFPISSNVDFGANTDGLDTSTFYFYPYIEQGYEFYYRNPSNSSSGSKGTCTQSGRYHLLTSNGFKYGTFKTLISEDPLKFGNIPYLKQLTFNSGYYWDGTSYFFENSESEDPETPTMPSNSEIASAVQMFYNSVYNLPNIGFKDFVVLYDNTTGLYTYIGHNRDNSLGQVIVEPNGYYEGYKFDVQWWKFYLENSEDEWWFENIDGYFSYFVYTSDGTIENLNYVGKSNISGLIEKSGPWATAKTVIVYSTNDYPVKYVTFPDDSPDPDIQTGTIQGDQYTYDENLDITDNQYNPLDNFISINYPSTLVGNADFDSFLNTFNENKDVLILPQNANWVILANNSLFSHFSSFIIMCTLFIILQRVMRG